MESLPNLAQSEPLALCRQCDSVFLVEAVAACPRCGSRYLRAVKIKGSADASSPHATGPEPHTQHPAADPTYTHAQESDMDVTNPLELAEVYLSRAGHRTCFDDLGGGIQGLIVMMGNAMPDVLITKQSDGGGGDGVDIGWDADVSVEPLPCLDPRKAPDVLGQLLRQGYDDEEAT